MLLKCPICSQWNRFQTNQIDLGPVCASCKADLLLTPLEIDDITLEQLKNESSKPILVDFWAPWCGPCNFFAPIFKKNAEKYGNLLIHAKVNTEDFENASLTYQIRSIPTILVFHKQQEINRIIGALQSNDLEKLTLQLIQAKESY